MVFSKERLIVAVNRQGKPSQVVQLTEAGKLDRRFGKGGIVTLPAGARFGIAELAVDGNDRITLAGTLRTHIAVDRLGPDGSQDRTFAGGGVFHLDSAAKVPSGAPTVEGLSLSSGNGGGGIAVTATIGSHDVRFRLLGQTSHERCGSRRATIVGTSRSERIVGTPRADTIAALGGHDTIVGGRGNDVICGGSGRDTIEPGPGRDTVFP
jgi:Ca2+-binding RTX toxin-like protein